MASESENNFTAKQGLYYFLWIMIAWTLYVLFLNPSLAKITIIPYQIIGETIRILIFTVPVLIISYKTFENPLAELGITTNVWKGLLIGSIIALIWFSVAILVASQTQNRQMTQSNLNVAFWLTAFSVSTIIEELGFRALLLNSLKPIGVSFAIIASSIAFVVIHYPGWIIFNMMPNLATFISSSVSIFILGLVLAIVYIRTNSIWAVIIIHAFNNLAAAMMTQK